MNTTTKKRMIAAAKIIAAIAICYSIFSATGTYRDEIGSIKNIHLGMLATILGLCITYRVTNALGWSIVLKALGQRIGTATALRIWITSEACRWLPGSVWSYGSRAVQARNHGASTVAAGSSLMLELLLTILAWVATATIGLFAYRAAFAEFIQKIPFGTIATTGTVIAVGIASLFFGSKTVSRKFKSKATGALTKIKALGTLKIDRRRTATAGVYYFVMCLFNGFICSLVVNSIAPTADVPVLAVIGINAAAWLIGFFAFLAPGGLVVREGALAALLAIWLPADQALAVAIAWRMIQIAAEIACMGATWSVTSIQVMQTRVVAWCRVNVLISATKAYRLRELPGAE